MGVAAFTKQAVKGLEELQLRLVVWALIVT